MEIKKQYSTIVVPAAEEYTLKGRLNAIREKKNSQLQWKMDKNKCMDEDDYGYVPAPDDFVFYPEFNDSEHNTFYGADYWSKNFSNLLKIHPVYIDLNDALCCRWMFILQRFRPFESVVSNANMEMAPIFDYSWLKEDQKKYDLLTGIGKMHHFAPDYTIGLELGWGGIRKKIEHYMTINTSAESQELYRAEIVILDGIRVWMDHAIEAMEELNKKIEKGLVKDNLERMIETNKWLLENPPRTFLEACQWIDWYNMLNRTYNRAGAGCQLDVVLLPYYKRDVESGILTPNEAKFIISCLFIGDPTYYQIGGPNKDTGEDVTSELSFLILEAAHDLKTTVNLTIRYFDKLNMRLFRRGLEILMEDKQACPRFSGDNALVEGFCKNGYPVELARQRNTVGCNWTSLPGREYTMNDLVKVNLAKVFEIAFYEMVADGKYSTDILYEKFRYHLQKAVDCLKAGLDFHLQNQWKNGPELLLNLCSHGPIEKGLDASHGGMEFYNLGIDAAGIAIVADSFGAIQQRVENEKVITWEKCIDAVRNNFEGQDSRYIQSIMNSADRYGHGGTLSDDWALRISKLFTEMVAGSRTPDGYLTIPGLFSWANTVMFGKSVGATPNGRKAGEPINHGANPLPGFRKDGAFSAMGNAIAMVQPGYGNTAPWQLELTPTIIDNDEALANIEAVLVSHFKQGGTLININIMDNRKIMEAYEDPAKYPDLVVRVTGFTAYFSALSPEFRRMIVDRIVTDR